MQLCKLFYLLVSYQLFQNEVSLSAGFSTTIVPPFVAVIGHAITSAPISYIPHTKAEQTLTERAPFKLPRSDGEDTWCILLEHSKSVGNDSTGHPPIGADGRINWCLIESLGRWDNRWG